ncbi:integration host factor subunit alpha [Thermodesulfobacteriota bacterium]
MTLTKADIIDSLYNNCGFFKTKSEELTEAILESIKKTLESGENVLISGFGKFSVNKKNERRGRNPGTGDDLILEARRVVTFKCSESLRDKINGES